MEGRCLASVPGGMLHVVVSAPICQNAIRQTMEALISTSRPIIFKWLLAEECNQSITDKILLKASLCLSLCLSPALFPASLLFRIKQGHRFLYRTPVTRVFNATAEWRSRDQWPRRRRPRTTLVMSGITALLLSPMWSVSNIATICCLWGSLKNFLLIFFPPVRDHKRRGGHGNHVLSDVPLVQGCRETACWNKAVVSQWHHMDNLLLPSITRDVAWKRLNYCLQGRD